MTTPAPTASARWTNKNQKGEFHAKLITVTCHKRHPARQTGSSAQLCDIRRMYFANSLVYWHWNSFITLALKLLRHVHSSDCICLVFWMGNWNSSPPIKFTLLVVATDHRPAVDQGGRKSSGNILFSLLRGGAVSVGENVVGGLSWVPFTVGGLSWLVLVSSWDFRQPKFFSGLIHRKIINPRLQGFPSFLRGKPWLRFVEGLSLFRRKGIITKAMFAPIY